MRKKNCENSGQFLDFPVLIIVYFLVYYWISIIEYNERCFICKCCFVKMDWSWINSIMDYQIKEISNSKNIFDLEEIVVTCLFAG